MDLLREISALTTFLILLLSTKIRSQPLIDNVDQQCSDFHNDVKLDKMKTLLNDLENRLEKTTLQLDMALADRKSIYGNYVDLMMMYSKGETPDGKNRFEN